MKDEYECFAQLAKNESEDIDFRIDLRPGTSDVAIIAPHGGKIEPGTSKIAAAIADDTHHFYGFLGQKTQRNRTLHITSSRFDEPKCMRLIEECDFVVAVHGCLGPGQTVFLGGKDSTLREAIKRELTSAGFKAERHRNPQLQGVSKDNVCNRGRSRLGVQLEIEAGLRDLVVEDGTVMQRLAGAVRAALRDTNRMRS